MSDNRFDYVVDLTGYAENCFTVTATFHMHKPNNLFTLSAMAVNNGINFELLTLETLDGERIPLNSPDFDSLFIAPQNFKISYSVSSVYGNCMGVDKKYDFIYPFFDHEEEEFFFGTGLLIYPTRMRHDDIYADAFLKLVNLPEGFSLYTNFWLDSGNEGEISEEKLDGFFVYSARRVAPVVEQFPLNDGRMFELHVLVEHEKSIPFGEEDLIRFADGYMDFLEDEIAPFKQSEQIKLLMLQAPPNFLKTANHRTFATGENFVNGIITYAPHDEVYLKRVFGYTDYAYYLYDGFVHEMMHFYTTCSTNRAKSAIFSSPDCSRHDCWMIGEVLASYFHNMYMAKYYKGSLTHFITHNIVNALNLWKRNNQRNYTLDWFAFDIHLRYEHDLSLRALFREMVLEKQRDRTPYTSVEWVFEVLERMGVEVEEDTRVFLRKSALPDYERVIKESLRLLGYDLIYEDNTYKVQESSYDVAQIEFAM